MEPDRQTSKSEKVATVEEISLAIEKLTPAEWAERWKAVLRTP